MKNDLSDHHHLIFSIMETNLALEEPKKLVYQNSKSLNNDYFKEELSSKLILNNQQGLHGFLEYLC